MIVDLLRNDLGRLATPGEFGLTSCAVEDVSDFMAAGVDRVGVAARHAFRALFQALFPCGSITGAPKIQAHAADCRTRGRRAWLIQGTLGWVAPSGDCRLNVAIETIELEGDGRGRLHVGSGIVIDAQPDREYAGVC